MLDIVTPEAVGIDSGQLARVGEHLGQRYVAPGKIPGSITLVARGGQACYLDIQGHRDVERGTPMTADTIVRIYSMSKPITSLAMMTLLERGLFSLDDPVHRFIPAWRNLGVWTGGSYPLFATAPTKRPMTIRDLLLHTSGITYGFYGDSLVRKAIAAAEIYAGDPSNEEFVERIAKGGIKVKKKKAAPAVDRRAVEFAWLKQLKEVIA